MKNFLPGCCILLLSIPAQAQYFYNDIIGSANTERLMKTYRDNNVRQVSATGFDHNNVKATDFIEFHEVKDNGSTLKITNGTTVSRSVTYHRFNPEGRLITTTDSSAVQSSELTYKYDANGRISRLENRTGDGSGEVQVTEVHQWIYDANGKPQKMLRLLTEAGDARTDTLEIRFVADEEGNTGDEITFRRNRETGRIYYYYDDRGRLTDIVRFNSKLGRLMPDVMFEYDDSDRVIQKITTTSDRTVAYLIWRYVFDGKGLKTKEAMFDNYKDLKGKIEYSYTF